MNKEQIKAIVEGLLYIVGEEGVTAEQLSSVLNLLPLETDTILQELTEEYKREAHGFELVSYGGLYRLVSKAFVYDYAEKLFKMGRSNSLSAAAVETLAIIAYKQPITRIEIEEIRGVGCEVMLRKLLARNLIKEAGRSQAPGRPILYAVTEEFMDVFKLVSLKELPDLPDYQQGEGDDSLFEFDR